MFIEWLQYGGWILIWAILFLASLAFWAVYQLNKDPYEKLDPNNPRTNIFLGWGFKTWSDVNGLPETVIYWMMVPMFLAAIAWDWFYCPSLYYYITVMKQIFTDEAARSSLATWWLPVNILVRIVLIAMSFSILRFGALMVDWPHGVARFAFGRKLRVMNDGLHFMLIAFFAKWQPIKGSDNSAATKKKGGDKEPVKMEMVPALQVGRNVLVLRDELRASVILTEGGMSSDEARKVLTTEPLPTTLAITGAGAAASGSGGATLQFPHNFYFVKWNLFTYLGTSPTTLDKHLITSVDDQFQADWRRFTSVLQYDQARFVQGNVFLFADQTDLVAKMKEYDARFGDDKVNPTDSWSEYQKYLATRGASDEERFDIQEFEKLKVARDYEAMAAMITDRAPNSLACRILRQFGIIVTFFGIENGIEEPGIVKEREALKEAEIKIRRDFLEGGAEMRQALGTILSQHGIDLTAWETMVTNDSNPGLKLEIMRAMMEIWKFNKTLGAVSKGDKIIMTGQHAGILPDVITASIAAQQPAAAAQRQQTTAGSAAGTTATTPAPASTTSARPPRPSQPNRGQGRSRGRRP